MFLDSNPVNVKHRMVDSQLTSVIAYNASISACETWQREVQGFICGLHRGYLGLYRDLGCRV